MRNKGTVLKKMVIYLLAIFMVPLCTAVVFYEYSSKVLEDQARVFDEQHLITIQSVCDQELEHYQGLLTQLIVEKDVRDLGKKQEFTPEDWIKVSKLYDKLLVVQSSSLQLSKACVDIFVYFPNADRIVGSTTGGSSGLLTYFESVFRTKDVDIISLQDELKTNTASGVHSVQISPLSSRWMLVSIPLADQNAVPYAVLGVWIDPERLLAQNSQIDISTAQEVLIADANGNLFKTPSGIEGKESANKLSDYATNQGYAITSVTSADTNITYALLTPSDVIFSSVRSLRILFTISTILCIAAGCFLAWRFLRVNYTPLEEILAVFQEDMAWEHGDEYRYLHSHITTLLEKNEEMEGKMQRSSNAISKIGLVQLLLNPNPRNLDGPKISRWANQLKNGDNQVYLLHSAEIAIEQLLEGTDEVIKHRKESATTSYPVEIDGRVAIIFHSEDLSRTDDQRDIHLILQAIRAKCRDLTVSSGKVYHALFGIHLSYMEASEAAEFAADLDQDMIHYSDIEDATNRRYEYPIQAENRILDAISVNNADMAIALVNRVIDVNFDESKHSFYFRKAVLLHLYCTLLRAADEKGVLNKIEVHLLTLNMSKDIDTVRAEFAAIIRSLCINENDRSVNSNREFCDRVLAFVQENYANPILNISQTALHFNIAPSKLSSIYKKETGKSLLHVISEIRIEKAIQLLSQGVSISECGPMVGIEESVTFSRLFKKHTGVTPGQMKASWGQNSK